jgi:hypothetical protein
MKVRSQDEPEESAAREVLDGAELLLPLVQGQPTTGAAVDACAGVVIGELIGIKDDDGTPLVVHPGQLGAQAVQGRTIVDLRSTHIGMHVVLMFEGGDPAKPIILGVLREAAGRSPKPASGQFEIDADGQRVIVTATKQIVLRCGAASITLTESGKVLIQGEYVSSRASGVNRIKGGSVQIN